MSASADRPPTPLERELERYIRYVSLERGRSTNTIQAYRRDLQAWLRWLEGRQVSDAQAVSARHVADYVASLSGAATTIARALSSIRTFHRYLLDEGVVSSDPTAEVPAPALPARLPKALSIEQVQSLLETVIGDEPEALRDRALLEFLYATGARITEAVSMSVDDVLGDDQRTRETIRVTGKGKKQRVVPIGSYARAALDAYLTRARPIFAKRAARSSANVFLGSRGGPLSRQNAWLILQRAAERANLPGSVSPHTLRHSFATHILAGGADIRVVQELLGHSSVQTTQIYTRVTIDTLRDVYQSAHPRAR